MNRLTKERPAQVLACLIEGNSIRLMARADKGSQERHCQAAEGCPAGLC